VQAALKAVRVMRITLGKQTKRLSSASGSTFSTEVKALRVMRIILGKQQAIQLAVSAE
jgi:hypothetical protein